MFAVAYFLAYNVYGKGLSLCGGLRRNADKCISVDAGTGWLD